MLLLLASAPVASSEWTPANLTTQPLGWYDAADTATITLSGSEVTSWGNKGTAANGDLDETSLGPGTRPTYSATAFNASYPGIVFGTNDDLICSDGSMAPWSGAHAVFVVLKDDGATTNYRTIYATERSAGDQYGLQFRASNYRLHLTEPGISGEDTTNEFTSGGPGQISFISTAGISGGNLSGNVYLDGTVDPTTLDLTGLGTPTHTGMRLGSYAYATGTLNCTMAEVIVLNYAPTTAERLYIEGYLAHKWGTTSRLPSNHPFKNTPPYTDAWTPEVLGANLRVWLNVRNGSGDITFGTGSDVATWGSHGTTTFDATTPDAGRRPQYATNLLNGHPGIEFSKNIDQLYIDTEGSDKTSGSIWNGPFTVISILRNNSVPWTGMYGTYPCNASNRGMQVMAWEGTNRIGFAEPVTGAVDSGLSWSNGVPASTPDIVVFRSAAGIATPTPALTANFIKNGGTPSADLTRSPFTNQNAGGMLIRGIHLGYPDYDIGGGWYIGEFIFVNSYLTGDDLNKLIGYVHHNWDLESLLPSDHPYKNIAPTAPATGGGPNYQFGAGASAGVATAAATGAPRFTGAGASAGVATAAAEGSTAGSVQSGAGASAGVATAAATGASTATSAGASAGVATATATGASTVTSAGNSAGVATTAAVGAPRFAGVGSAAGVATATGDASSGTNAVGSSTGVATAAAVGAPRFAGAGASAGVATASAIADTPASTGSTAGTSTASAVGAPRMAGAGSAAGAATAAAVGTARIAGAGSSAGTATAAATAAPRAAGAGSSAGVATAAATGTNVGSIGSVSAGSTANAVSAATKLAAGAAAGTSTAAGRYKRIGPLEPSDVYNVFVPFRSAQAVVSSEQQSMLPSRANEVRDLVASGTATDQNIIVTN